MMAIGIGANSGVSIEDLAAAIQQAAFQAGARADAVATIESALFLEPLREAAKQIATPLTPLALVCLQQRSRDCRTVSQRSLDLFGVASISEAAALAAAGPGSKLIVPRMTFGNVTAAVAQSSDHVKDAS